jgi:hypothetical protein
MQREPPVLTGVIVLSLASSIGANSAAFGIADALLLRISVWFRMTLGATAHRGWSQIGTLGVTPNRSIWGALLLLLGRMYQLPCDGRQTA